jgi:hypothetical protein
MKAYVIFIDSLTTTGPESQIVYRLADMEEIEINRHTAKTFLDLQCRDDADYRSSMIVFYADQTNTCKQFTVTCTSDSSIAVEIRSMHSYFACSI